MTIRSSCVILSNDRPSTDGVSFLSNISSNDFTQKPKLM